MHSKRAIANVLSTVTTKPAEEDTAADDHSVESLGAEPIEEEDSSGEFAAARQRSERMRAQKAAAVVT